MSFPSSQRRTSTQELGAARAGFRRNQQQRTTDEVSLAGKSTASSTVASFIGDVQAVFKSHHSVADEDTLGGKSTASMTIVSFIGDIVGAIEEAKTEKENNASLPVMDLEQKQPTSIPTSTRAASNTAASIATTATEDKSHQSIGESSHSERTEVKLEHPDAAPSRQTAKKSNSEGSVTEEEAQLTNEDAPNGELELGDAFMPYGFVKDIDDFHDGQPELIEEARHSRELQATTPPGADADDTSITLSVDEDLTETETHGEDETIGSHCLNLEMSLKMLGDYWTDEPNDNRSIAGIDSEMSVAASEITTKSSFHRHNALLTAVQSSRNLGLGCKRSQVMPETQEEETATPEKFDQEPGSVKSGDFPTAIRGRSWCGKILCWVGFLSILSILGAGLVVALVWLLPSLEGGSKDAAADVGITNRSCGHTVQKEGLVVLHVKDASLESIESKRVEFEKAFLRSYNEASGMCDGTFERVLQFANLEETKEIISQADGLTRLTWSALVNCNGCHDFEPLFANRAESRNLRSLATDDSREIFEKFYELLSLEVPSLLESPDAKVVYLASISSSGEADQVFEIEGSSSANAHLEASSAASPPTQHANPSAGGSSIFFGEEIKEDMDPEDDSVTFCVIDLSTGKAVPGYEELRDGIIIEKSALPSQITIEAKSNSSLPGMELTLTRDQASLYDTVDTQAPWFLVEGQSIEQKYDQTDNGGDSLFDVLWPGSHFYKLAATPVDYATNHIFHVTERGAKTSIRFVVQDGSR